MTIDNGELVIGDGSEVYYIQDKKRRWVPDYLTLQALNHQGWAAVKKATQDELLGIELGAPLPPMFDGSVLISTDGSAHVARNGRLHPVPDAETLAIYPRRRVALISPNDIDLLKASLGRPLVSIKKASQNALEIDSYIRSLAPLPYEENHDERGPITKRPGVTEVDGVPMEVMEQRVRLVRQVADFVEISPIPDVMWAGATITGASIQPGSLAPIALDRSSGWITLTTDLTLPTVRSQSRQLNQPSLRAYVDTLNELIDDLKPTDSAASGSYRTQQIATLEEGMVSLGLNLKGAGWGVDAKARLDARLDHSTTFGTFSQAYYQVAFTPEGSPPKFFADHVSVDDVKLYAGPNNPPCYISSITYGRMLTFLVDSEASSLDVQMAISGTWQLAVSGKVDVEGSYKKTLDRSSITVVVVGGSSGTVGNVISDPANNLLPWIQNQLKITKDLPAAPIQYTVRYLTPPHHLVRVSRATDPIKIVDANVYGGREVAGTYNVGEGPGQGPIATGLWVNRGDEFTITATGSIWAGWTFLGANGPEGLDGPPKTWYPLPNGKDVKASMLIGGYNNANWFPIGSGTRRIVPAEQDRSEIWLRLNDEDMANGNGAFKVAVSLRRRVPIINAAG